MKQKPGILFLEFPDAAREILDEMTLCTADANFSADDIIELAEFLGRLIYHCKNVLCTLAQEHSLIIQAHTFIRADKQLMAQLFLQLFDLF